MFVTCAAEIANRRAKRRCCHIRPKEGQMHITDNDRNGHRLHYRYHDDKQVSSVGTLALLLR